VPELVENISEYIKGTRAYRMYRESRAYDEVRRHGKALKRAIKLPRYLGNQYQCPICDCKLRAFRAGPWKSSLRAARKYQPVHLASEMETLNLAAFLCPSCDALDRDRLVWLYLEQLFHSLDHTRTYRFLEFAPRGALDKKIKGYPFISYRSADLTRKDVDEQVDLTAMSTYPDNSVDILMCLHVLEHIPDDGAAMREIKRVLKPDGLGIVLVPLYVGVDETHEDPSINTEALRWKYFGQGDHVRQYGKRNFVDRLEAASLKVEQLGIAHFGAEAFRRAGIADNSVLYVVRPR